MASRNSKPIEILLIEDNPGDVRLIEEALREVKVRNSMTVIGNGIEAMAFLHKQERYARVSSPGLILLDLNLPGKNGFEILQEIKQDSLLKRIPVVILTSSQSEQDIVKSYNLYANAYISKPVSLDQFFDVVKAIEGFWLEIVRLPQDVAAED
jgi:two-component system, chemotaxis family, response regulator Rcp1